MRVLILGGTGYIGIILAKYFALNNIVAFLKGTHFYKSERIADIDCVKQFIATNNITHIFDLTRSTMRSLVGFYSLIKELKDIIYIHLNSYSLIDLEVYKGCKFDAIEQNVAIKIDKYLLKNNCRYYSFITPQIVNDIDNFVADDKITIRTNYTYCCNEVDFVNFIINTILTMQFGVYIVPAIRKEIY